MEATARRLLLGSRVYPPLRLGYQFLFDRARFANRQAMRRFYSAFVRKGDLVFDVGAHVGRHAELFTDLGAAVVSIEPNPSCCEQLRHLAKIRNVRVENCAAGDAPGKLKLRICQDSVISTVSRSLVRRGQTVATPPRCAVDRECGSECRHPGPIGRAVWNSQFCQDRC